MMPTFIRIATMMLLTPTFAGTAAAAQEYGVFKSTDRGRSWVRSDRGIDTGSRINAFGSLDETVFAGTDSGIFISQDEAGSWRPAPGVTTTSDRILGFAVLGDKVFAGTDGSGMLVSADGGESWVLSATSRARKLRCLLAHRGRVYAGTEAKGVFVSSDHGETWVSLNQDFPAHAQVFALSVVEDRLFVGLYSKGLYGWSEQEMRWRKAGTIAPLVLAAIGGTLIAGHNPGGLFWSADLGASWEKGTASEIGPFPSLVPPDAGELPSEAPVWELAANDELVFAGAASGVYYSEDRGRTWARARTGLPAESPAISFLPRGTFILAAVLMR
jgi:photosystem II stability/assembly factor-like uncharacterized protein